MISVPALLSDGLTLTVGASSCTSTCCCSTSICKLDIELLDLPGLNLDLGFVVYRKAFRNRSDVVRPGDKAIDLVNALMVSLGGDSFAAGTGSRDRCLGNNRSGRIRNPSRASFQKRFAPTQARQQLDTIRKR